MTTLSRVDATNATVSPAIFATWYIDRGKPWLRNRVDQLARRIGLAPPSLFARDRGYRWRACRPDGVLAFHWRTVGLPPRIIEYVAGAKILRLLAPHPGRDFWRRPEFAMSDFGVTKPLLDEHGPKD